MRRVDRRTGLLLLVAMGAVSGCGRPAPQIVTMPSPEGCFVQVWERAGFSGRSDFLNGPRRYEDLEDLPGRTSWKGRVRSVRLGPAASAVAWSDERFEGRQVLLGPDAGRALGFESLPVDVESLEIRCVRQAGRVAGNIDNVRRIP